MELWILNAKTGLSILYKSFSRLNVEADLISGLLSAFHQFTMAEFNKPIESIIMGGLRWVYILDNDLDLLFVSADVQEVDGNLIRDRLNTIKDEFIKVYKEEWTKKRDNWDGDSSIFDTFKDKLEDIYMQWEETEIVNTLADFFDYLGVFQQIFNLIFSVIKSIDNQEKKEYIVKRIEEIFENKKIDPQFKNELEMQKFTFSRDSGFKIITINPANCDPMLIKSVLTIIIKEVVAIFKETLGEDACIILFRNGKIFEFIINNKELISVVSLEEFLSRLFILLD